MLESPLSGNIAGNSLTIANQLVLVSGKPFEAHRPTRMEFARADPQLRAEPITEAVGEASGYVVINARRSHSLHKM